MKATVENRFPNIAALSQGCVSGHWNEWPMMKPGAKALLAELARLESFERAVRFFISVEPRL